MVSIIKSKLLEKRTELARAKSLNKNESGVTIVELMIVVAVAALIIVLVLVAAPALQRNARNSQRRNDIGAIKGQLTTVVANNNGQYPTLANFNRDILGQIEQGVYEDDVAITKTTTLATNTPVAPTIVYWERTSTQTTQALLNTAMALQSYPNQDEVHVIVGVQCQALELSAGGLEPGDAGVAYTAGDILLASSRTYAFIYQLEGEATARCEDNA